MKRDAPLAEAGEHAARVVREAAGGVWVERLARLGYAAKGVVYILVGALAALAAAGIGGEITDARGALHRIVVAPFGRVMLGIVALGLVGYALWKFVQAFADAEAKGNSAKGLAVRAGYAISGVIHLALTLTAVALIRGSTQSDSGGDSLQDYAASLMAQPFGRWLIALIGATVAGFGISQLIKAYTAKFQRKLRTNEMSDAERALTLRSGRLGFAARGIVFLIIGYFILRAALAYDPAQVQGVGGALRTIFDNPLGTILLFIVAAGLVAYGVYLLIAARYRHIHAH